MGTSRIPEVDSEELRRQKGNYFDLVMAAAAKAKPGVVTHIHVYHDAWCGVYNGRPCNCNPELHVGDPASN